MELEWYMDYDHDLNRNVLAATILEPEKNYRVDLWGRFGYEEHDKGKFFETTEEAVKWGRKQLKRGAHQARIVDLRGDDA